MTLEFRRLQPEEFYRQHLQAGLRPDGRALLERRPMAVTVDSLARADGSAVVRLGNTTVAAGVKLELAAPPPESPCRGYLVPNLAMPAMCGPQYRPGPPPPGNIITVLSYLNDLDIG